MKPFIDSAFWSDPDVESCKAGVKLAALWLITNSQTSLIGICGASPARFEFETGLKSEALESAVQALPRAFKRFGSAVFVTRYIHHQFGRGEKLKRNNFFVALRSLFESIKDEELKAFFLAEYPEFLPAQPADARRASEGLAKPKDGGIGKERNGNGKEGGSAEGEIDPIKLRLNALFARRPSTLWSDAELKTYRKIGEITPEDMGFIEKYYAHERLKGEDQKTGGHHRRDLTTFLNNFSGELDRARSHKPFTGVTKNNIDKDQWKRFLTSLPRPYEDPMTAMPYLRDDFHKWMRLQ